MKILLDTHCWIWAISRPEKLNSKVFKWIEEPKNSIFLSAASLWEISIKQKLGKIKFQISLEEFIFQQGREERFIELPITFRHAVKQATLPSHHRDPFDRILVAQALCEDLILVTADQLLLQYPGKIEWAAAARS